MGQVLGPDNIPPLVRASSTTCTLASTSEGRPTRITIGGQQYHVSSTLTLNTATTGLGGLDTGALGSSHQLYYVYACVNSSGVVGLVASLSGPSTGPTGFTRWKIVGAFYVRDVAEIGSTVTIGGSAESEWQIFTSAILGSVTNPTAGAGGTKSYLWRRHGQDMELYLVYQQTAAGADGSGSYFFRMPSNLAIDTDKVPGFGSTQAVVGAGALLITSTNYAAWPRVESASRIGIFLHNDTQAPAAWGSALGQLSTATIRCTAKVKVPIVGWSKTLF